MLAKDYLGRNGCGQRSLSTHKKFRHSTKMRSMRSNYFILRNSTRDRTSSTLIAPPLPTSPRLAPPPPHVHAHAKNKNRNAQSMLPTRALQHELAGVDAGGSAWHLSWQSLYICTQHEQLAHMHRIRIIPRRLSTASTCACSMQSGSARMVLSIWRKAPQTSHDLAPAHRLKYARLGAS